MSNLAKALLVILAVIRAIALIALLGIWLMHTAMMGGTGMMDCCPGGMMAGVSWLLGLLALIGLAAAVFLLVRRR